MNIGGVDAVQAVSLALQMIVLKYPRAVITSRVTCISKLPAADMAFRSVRVCAIF